MLDASATSGLSSFNSSNVLLLDVESAIFYFLSKVNLEQWTELEQINGFDALMDEFRCVISVGLMIGIYYEDLVEV